MREHRAFAPFTLLIKISIRTTKSAAVDSMHRVCQKMLLACKPNFEDCGGGGGSLRCSFVPQYLGKGEPQNI